MKWVGLVLVSVGLIIAAAFGARHGEQFTEYRSALKGSAEAAEAVGLPEPEERVMQWLGSNGVGFGFGVFVIVVGAAISRREAKLEATGGSGGAKVDFPAAMNEGLRVVALLEPMLAELKMGGDSEPARRELDGLAEGVFAELVDGRGQLIARHGIGGFAEYFGTFSAAERNLARCWSAITDGHAVEARASLGRAKESLHDAIEAWEKVDA